MSWWIIGPHRPAPTDAEYERLREFTIGDPCSSPSPRRAMGFLASMLAVGVVTVTVAAFLPRWCVAPCIFLGVLLLWFALRRVNRWARVLHARDRLLQRPDLTPCDACGSTADVHPDGCATCRSCGTTTNVEGWPRSALGEPPALKPLSDTGYSAALAFGNTLKRQGLVMLAVLMVLIVICVIGVVLVAAGNPPLQYAPLASVSLCLFVVINGGIERRADACSLLLLTRPDLWNPATTHLAVHEVRGMDARYIRTLEHARRLGERLEDRAASGSASA